MAQLMVSPEKPISQMKTQIAGLEGAGFGSLVVSAKCPILLEIILGGIAMRFDLLPCQKFLAVSILSLWILLSRYSGGQPGPTLRRARGGRRRDAPGLGGEERGDLPAAAPGAAAEWRHQQRRAGAFTGGDDWKKALVWNIFGICLELKGELKKAGVFRC